MSKPPFSWPQEAFLPKRLGQHALAHETPPEVVAALLSNGLMTGSELWRSLGKEEMHGLWTGQPAWLPWASMVAETWKKPAPSNQVPEIGSAGYWMQEVLRQAWQDEGPMRAWVKRSSLDSQSKVLEGLADGGWHQALGEALRVLSPDPVMFEHLCITLAKEGKAAPLATLASHPLATKCSARTRQAMALEAKDAACLALALQMGAAPWLPESSQKKDTRLVCERWLEGIDRKTPARKLEPLEAKFAEVLKFLRANPALTAQHQDAVQRAAQEFQRLAFVAHPHSWPKATSLLAHLARWTTDRPQEERYGQEGLTLASLVWFSEPTTLPAEWIPLLAQHVSDRALDEDDLLGISQRERWWGLLWAQDCNENQIQEPWQPRASESHPPTWIERDPEGLDLDIVVDRLSRLLAATPIWRGEGSKRTNLESDQLKKRLGMSALALLHLWALPDQDSSAWRWDRPGVLLKRLVPQMAARGAKGLWARAEEDSSPPILGLLEAVVTVQAEEGLLGEDVDEALRAVFVRGVLPHIAQQPQMVQERLVALFERMAKKSLARENLDEQGSGPKVAAWMGQGAQWLAAARAWVERDSVALAESAVLSTKHPGRLAFSLLAFGGLAALESRGMAVDWAGLAAVAHHEVSEARWDGARVLAKGLAPLIESMVQERHLSQALPRGLAGRAKSRL